MVTLLSGADQSVECYIAELGGLGGGVAANLNRWRRQVGADPLSEAALADLPGITVLGQSVPLLDVEGTFQGMSGAARADSRLLGTVVPAEGRTFFIKMVGPSAEVAAQREAFVAFCESLREN